MGIILGSCVDFFSYIMNRGFLVFFSMLTSTQKVKWLSVHYLPLGCETTEMSTGKAKPTHKSNNPTHFLACTYKDASKAKES